MRFSIFFLFVMLHSHFIWGSNAKKKYFKNISIQVKEIDVQRKKYSSQFLLSKEIKMPPKKGKYSYFCAFYDELEILQSITKRGDDHLPVWEAKWSKSQLSTFTRFRDFETSLPRAVVTKPFLEKIRFNNSGQLIETIRYFNNHSFQELFYYQQQDQKLLKRDFFKNGKYQKQLKYIYTQDQLVRKELHRYYPAQKSLKLDRYEVLSTYPASKGNSNIRAVKSEYYDHENRIYKKTHQIYDGDYLLMANDSSGIKEIYYYTNFVISSHLQSSEKINRKNLKVIDHIALLDEFLNKEKKMNWFEYSQNKTDQTDFNLKPMLVRMSLLHQIDTDFSKRFMNEEFHLYDSLGTVKEWLRFEKNPHQIKQMEKSQTGLGRYTYIFDKRSRVKRKVIHDQDQKLLGAYQYSYNNSDLLEEEEFINSEKELTRKTKYFYRTKNSKNKIGSISKGIEHGYLGDVYFFAFRSLFEDLKRTSDDEKNKFKKSENIDVSRERLIDSLIKAHERGLEKVVNYQKGDKVISYVRIKSSQSNKSAPIVFTVKYFHKGIDFYYRENKGAQFYKKKPYFYVDKRDPEYVDPVGHFKEFHFLTADGVSLNTDKNLESLKETYVYVIKNRKIIDFEKSIYNGYTDEPIKKYTLNKGMGKNLDGKQELKVNIKVTKKKSTFKAAIDTYIDSRVNN